MKRIMTAAVAAALLVFAPQAKASADCGAGFDPKPECRQQDREDHGYKPAKPDTRGIRMDAENRTIPNYEPGKPTLLQRRLAERSAPRGSRLRQGLALDGKSTMLQHRLAASQAGRPAWGPPTGAYGYTPTGIEMSDAVAQCQEAHDREDEISAHVVRAYGWMVRECGRRLVLLGDLPCMEEREVSKGLGKGYELTCTRRLGQA